MFRLRLVATLLFLFAVVEGAVAHGDDWPQLQGPNRDGISSETGFAHSWPEAGPRVLWSAPLGPGFAGAAVRDGEVYLLDRVDDARDILRVFKLADGQELWRYEYEAPGKVGHGGSRTPPTVDEKYVYTVGMMGHFLCIDRATHKPAWQKNLLTDFGVDTPSWGASQSPILYKDKVIVAPQSPDAYVIACKRDTGDIVWKTPRLGLLGYTSPNLVKIDGVDQLVMIAASNKALTELGGTFGLSPEDGSVLWKYEGFQCFIPIPYATVLPDDRLFITGGYKAGSAMIQVKKGASGFDVKELFKLDSLTCGSQIHQPIFYKDYLYVNSNSNERQDGLTCFASDGTVKWRTSATEGQPLLERGNLLFADGMLIALDGKTGILYLIDPSPEGYKQLAQAKELEGKDIWAPMALSDGKLVLRSQDTLKCLDLKQP